MSIKNIYLRLLFVFLLFSFCSNALRAEKNDSINHSFLSPLNFRIGEHYGFIIPHRKSMQSFINGHTSTQELSILLPSSGKKIWQQYYNYPEIGISFLYSDLANTQQIGPMLAAIPFMDFKLNHRKVTMRFRLGTGLGYIDKPFDPETNIKNTAIGSHINAAIQGALAWGVKIQKHWQIDWGVSYTHLSNGSFKMPNLGINIPSVFASISCLPHASLIPEKYSGKEEAISKNTFIFLINGGIKEKYPAEGNKYGVGVLSAEWIRNLSHTSGLGAGFDLFYDFSEYAVLADEGKVSSWTESGKPSLKICYEQYFSRLTTGIQAGYYLYSKKTDIMFFYDRLFLRYDFNKNLMMNLSLVSHLSKADVVELGIGYKIFKR